MFIEINSTDETVKDMILNSEYILGVSLDKVNGAVIIDFNTKERCTITGKTKDEAVRMYNDIKQELFHNDLIQSREE